MYILAPRRESICFWANREHHNFLKLCLRLLSNHLALALAGGVATSILGRQARPLRNLLFRLMDASVPDEIQEVCVCLCFSTYPLVWWFTVACIFLWSMCAFCRLSSRLCPWERRCCYLLWEREWSYCTRSFLKDQTAGRAFLKDRYGFVPACKE